jgi:hypothetical protein
VGHRGGLFTIINYLIVIIRKQLFSFNFQFYVENKFLPPPKDNNSDICMEMYKIMLGCWHKDPHRRKPAQALMRDCNQIFYQGMYIKYK